MFVATVVITGLLAAAFAVSGVRKLAGGAGVRQEAAHLRVPFGGYRVIGVAEIAGSLALLTGLAWALLGVVTAGLLVLLMIGAFAAHIRVHDGPGTWAPAAALLLLTALTLGLRITTT
ncbi:putative membrane protein [Catenuloplanes nepalensis]|uniref:Membrane protein n=1 Tax=Catenuloplanes nepalensis TaxID=587533 RepID=A0ABT9MR65_9ACTN|nr:DoxX family protein [Catenuloplanes nepalensis]MDP9793927.1 putative membrane protein [Catenuloplanes nepalensis]